MDGVREVNVFMAKVAQECGKYEDCIRYMRDVINQGRPLSFNERNLLSSAYKGIVSPLRDSIRLLQDDAHGFDVDLSILECSEALSQKCDEVISLIQNTLLPSVTEPEVRVFYIKLTADYYRYKWEATPNSGRPDVAAKCKASYQEAAALADTSLPTYHPLRLGLALNFAVFIYEILGETAEAHELASRAYQEAGSGINQLSQESKEEATHTLELLNENIHLWSQ
ncbi:14-3-3 protein [Trichomonas vaginalis G3]|uniref:14-3-3 protein n=1 Tax=Trichomonas vaginalis (strain ATCC PRA-98 / G3) TaxID=412133 RepID=A2FEZ0_TRIV3|nr:protein domain specific binding [Trichomonas vaginalis G3]EAX96544.1 14-3-3 protein [Trichomonas vaginalis G3]KAI5541088.1 protein domain specific binding [Trichomonas vaginalis G3]|eukprot:XP_001309474.1 14-3-3 protein [Trichomonas vaginalis G3]